MLAVNRWVRDYLESFPEVRVEADYTARLVDIIHEGFDLAIRVGELEDSQLAARKLGQLHYGLFASPGYLARHGRPLSPEALGEHELLAFSAGAEDGEWRLRHLHGEERRVALAPRLTINNSFAVCDVALAGLGIAQLPLIVAQAHVEAGRLLPLLDQWRREPVPVHAVFPSSRFLTPKVRAFIDLASNKFP